MEVAIALAYNEKVTIVAVKSFMLLAPGVNLIKYFNINVLAPFCKLDVCTAKQQIL